MFEDSMKNIRASKAMGMKTVLLHEGQVNTSLPDDVATVEDPAIDAVLANIGEVAVDVAPPRV